MKIDVYRKSVDKMKTSNVLTVLDFSQREFLFSIESDVVPQIGEKIYIDESGDEYKVISVRRVLSDKKNKTYSSEYFMVDVESAVLAEAKTLDHLYLAANNK